MMTKVSYIQFDEISAVLVGEENILMTSRGSLFRFCINSYVASSCRECPYFIFISHLINLLCLILVQSNPSEGQRTSQKAAAENPSESNTLSLSYMAGQNTCKSIRTSTLSSAICQYIPPNQVLPYKHENRQVSSYEVLSPHQLLCALCNQFWAALCKRVREEMGLLSMLLVLYVFLLNGLSMDTDAQQRCQRKPVYYCTVVQN